MSKKLSKEEQVASLFHPSERKVTRKQTIMIPITEQVIIMIQNIPIEIFTQIKLRPHHQIQLPRMKTNFKVECIQIMRSYHKYHLIQYMTPKKIAKEPYML